MPGMKTIVQEKRSISKLVEFCKYLFNIKFYYLRKIRGLRTFFTTGVVDDDFLGQVMLDIKVFDIYFFYSLI